MPTPNKIMQTLWPTRLRHQLILGVALVHLLLMTIFVVDLISRQRAFLRQQSREQTEGLAETLAVNSTSWVLAADVAGLQEIVASVEDYPGLRYALVLSPEGKVLAHSEPARIGSYLTDEISRSLFRGDATTRVLHADEALLDVAAPIRTSAGKTVGWARIGLGQEQIAGSLRVVSRNGLLYTLAAILVGSLFAFLIARGLTADLDKLLSVSNQIRNHRHDLRMAASRTEEVGRLGEGLNQMLDAVTNAEQALRRSAEEIQDLYDHAPCGYHSLDRDGTIVRINNTELSWLGYTRDEVVGRMKFTELTTASGLATFQREFPGFKQSGSVRDLEFELVRKDGSLLTVLLNATAIYDPAGNFVMSRSTLHDITERKRMELALRESERGLEEAQRVAGVGSWERDLTTGELRWSAEMYRLFGLAPGQFKPTHARALDLVHPDDRDRVAKTVAAKVAAGESYQLEYRLQLPHGDERIIAVSGQVECAPDGRPVRTHGVSQDITDRKRAEEAMRRLNRELRAISSCNQMLLRAADEPGLLRDICRILCDEVGYRMAWVGYAEADEAKTVRPVAWAGVEDGYLANANISWADTERGRGPTGTAIRDNAIVYAQDFATDERVLPWRESARARGYRSSIALPLKAGNAQILGALTIYSSETHAFTPDEIRLLEDLAGDLSFGIQALRNQAERQRAETEREQYFKFFNSSDDLMVIADPNGCFQRINPACTKVLGYSEIELLAKPFIEFVHPDDRQATQEEMARQMQCGYSINFENRYVCKDGSCRQLSWHASFVAREGITYATARDITARKQAEAALQESEDRYRKLVEESPDVIGIFQEDQLQFINAAGVREFGAKDKQQLLGLTSRQLIHPEDHPAMLERIRRRLNGVTNMYPAEVRYRRADGSCLPVEVIATPILLGGKPAVQFIARNITERRQAEARIREQAALLDAANDAIYVRTLDNTVTYWNEGAARLYGWARSEALGRKIQELAAPDTAAYAAAQAHLLAHGTWGGELRKTGRTGKELTLFCRWTLLRDEQNRPKEVLAINTDITEQKQLEAQFLRAQRMEGIGALAGGIAHDLNNILSPILMTAPLLRSSVSDPENRALLDTLETCARRGSDIIKQLLTFARGQPGARVPLPLRHLLTEMEKIIRETFPRNIRPQVDAARDLWLVLGDATQVQQALMNLCLNARDAMPEGGSLKLVAANLALGESEAIADAKPGDYVRVSVTDTGTGIPPGIIERIFDPFFTTKEIGKGTGLGLPSVLGIVRGHGGFVRVHSRVGQGTTFELFLPATREATVAVAAPPGLLPPRARGELILVVDDELSVRRTIEQALRRHGYAVRTASDGGQALTEFADHRAEIRAVLTDMMMPGMDGVTLIRGLQRLSPHLPILVMTGLAERGVVKGLEELEVQVLLNKPFASAELLAALNHALGRQRATEREPPG